MSNYIELLVTLGFLATLMWGMMNFLRRDMHKDLAEIRNSQLRTEARIDHLYEENNRLYRVLIDLVKKA